MTAYIVQVSMGDTPAGTVEYKTLFAVALLLFAITLLHQHLRPSRDAALPRGVRVSAAAVGRRASELRTRALPAPAAAASGDLPR